MNATEQPLQHSLEWHAQHSPDRLCIVDGERAVSYGALDRRARHLASQLCAGGLEPGARVVLLLPNSARFVIAFFAVLQAEAIAVPLHAETSVKEARRILAHCDATWLLADRRWLAKAASWGVRTVDMETEARTADRAPDIPSLPLPAPTRPLDDPALILYTSGSTGQPKGVTLSHRNLVANTRSILAYLNLRSTDRALAILPFSYAYGLSVLNTHLWCGASLVIENRSAFPPVVFETLARQRVTGLPGVPSTFLLLLAKGSAQKLDLPALRYLTCAGGRLPRNHVTRLRRTFPASDLYVMYGATEASARLTFLPPERLLDKPNSIGRPIAGVQMEVRREGRMVIDREEGELWVSGPNMTRGYWPLRSPADHALIDGWFNTGDLGWRDEEGYFYLVGRANQLIKIAGHRVSLAEIEEQLLGLDEVAECAVIARLHDTAGEQAEAHVVVAREGISVETLQRHLRAELPWYKRPTAIHLVDALPRGGNGKILRHLLRVPN